MNKKIIAVVMFLVGLSIGQFIGTQSTNALPTEKVSIYGNGSLVKWRIKDHNQFARMANKLISNQNEVIDNEDYMSADDKIDTSTLTVLELEN